MRACIIVLLLLPLYYPLFAQSPDSVRSDGVRLSLFARPQHNFYSASAGRYWARQRHTWELDVHYERDFYTAFEMVDYRQFGLKGGWRFYPARRPHRFRVFLQGMLYANQLQSSSLNRGFKDFRNHGLALMVGQGFALQVNPRVAVDLHWQFGASYNRGKYWYLPINSPFGYYRSGSDVYFMIQPFGTLSYRLGK